MLTPEAWSLILGAAQSPSTSLADRIKAAIEAVKSPSYQEVVVLNEIHGVLVRGSREVWKNPDGSIVGLGEKKDGAVLIVRLTDSGPIPSIADLQKCFHTTSRARSDDERMQQWAIWNTPVGQKSPVYVKDLYSCGK